MTQDNEKPDSLMKDWWGILAKKGLASSNDRWVTEASIQKANMDELEAERKKDDEVTQRILASGDEDAIMARLNELFVISEKRWFRIHTWDRLFPSKKQRSS